ncbi:MAG: hypothetical protein ABH828_01345 [archaeon]
MKESSWKDCLESNASIIISPDKAKANSLMKTSLGRIKFLKSIKLNKENINYVFEGYYTSVLELIHTLVIHEGFKVQTHLCLGFYLKDVLKKEELFRMFDDLRYKRNSLTYYGKEMEFKTAKKTITKAEKIMKELKEIINNIDKGIILKSDEELDKYLEEL